MVSHTTVVVKKSTKMALYEIAGILQQQYRKPVSAEMAILECIGVWRDASKREKPDHKTNP